MFVGFETMGFSDYLLNDEQILEISRRGDSIRIVYKAIDSFGDIYIEHLRLHYIIFTEGGVTFHNDARAKEVFQEYLNAKRAGEEVYIFPDDFHDIEYEDV